VMATARGGGPARRRRRRQAVAARVHSAGRSAKSKTTGKESFNYRYTKKWDGLIVYNINRI
jgi:hypothetical protein